MLKRKKEKDVSIALAPGMLFSLIWEYFGQESLTKLFPLYVREYPFATYQIRYQCPQHADDTQLFVTTDSGDAVQALAQCLDSAVGWMSAKN